jgi:hypothetical protein
MPVVTSCKYVFETLDMASSQSTPCDSSAVKTLPTLESVSPTPAPVFVIPVTCVPTVEGAKERAIECEYADGGPETIPSK